MYCPNCGKQIEENASFCIHCGTQVKIDLPASGQAEENKEHIYCPYCLSENITYGKEGFSGGKALTGAVLTGGVGLLAGFIGSKNVRITCMKCGNVFNAKEVLVITPSRKDSYKKQMDDAIRNHGTRSSFTDNVIRRWFPNLGGSGYGIALTYQKVNNIKLTQKAKNDDDKDAIMTNAGCTIIILIILLILHLLSK